MLKKPKPYHGTKICMQYADNLYVIRVHQNEKVWS